MTRPRDSPLRRLWSSSVVYALTGFAQQATGFLLIPIYTRLIEPADYAVLELLNAFFSVAMIAITLGLGSAINKVYHRDCETPDEQEAVVGTAVLVSLPVIALVSMGLLAGAEPMAALLTASGANARLLRIVVVSNGCSAIFGMLLAGLRAQERVTAYAMLAIVQFTGSLILNILLVVYLGLGVEGILIGNLGANVVALALAVLTLRRGNRLVFNRRLAYPLLAFGVAIIPNMLSGWVIDMSDRYLLRVFRDLDEVAQYGVGYKFGLAIQVLVTWPFQLGWPAIAFGISRDEGHERTYARVLTYLLLVLTPTLLVFAAVADSVLPALVGDEYAPGCRVVPVVALAYALAAVQFCVSPGIHLRGQTRRLSRVGMIAAAANMAIGLVVIPPWGTMGAAWATVAARAIALIGTAWLSQRCYPIRYEYGRMAGILAAGAAAYTAMLLVSAGTLGGWQLAGQAGAVGMFALIVLTSGIVDTQERRSLTAMLARFLPPSLRRPRGRAGAE